MIFAFRNSLSSYTEYNYCYGKNEKMFDSNLVRVFLIIYGIIAVGVSVLLWINSAASDALKNVGILMASLLPVVVTVFPYLKADKIERCYNYVLFYDSKEKRIITGTGNIQDMDNPYFRNYIDMFTNLSDENLKAESLDEIMEGAKGFNIIEKGIIEALMSRFMSCWDIELKKFKGLGSKRFEWHGNPKSETKVIELLQVKKIFSYNPLISAPNILIPLKGMTLPPDCIIQAKNTDYSREISFNTSYVKLQISMMFPYGKPIQQGVWGVLLPNSQDIHRYYAIVYPITATFYIKKTKAYAPEMESYRKWFENVCDVLSEYDWNTIDEQIEKSLNRNAILEISEIKKSITK